MRTTSRVAIILLSGFWVFVGWLAVSRTPWAAAVDIPGTGELFASAVAPLRLIAGALLVAVPSVLLIRAAWDWVSTAILGRPVRQRVPVVRSPSRESTARGRRESPLD